MSNSVLNLVSAARQYFIGQGSGKAPEDSPSDSVAHAKTIEHYYEEIHWINAGAGETIAEVGFDEHGQLGVVYLDQSTPNQP